MSNWPMTTTIDSHSEILNFCTVMLDVVLFYLVKWVVKFIQQLF